MKNTLRSKRQPSSQLDGFVAFILSQEATGSILAVTRVTQMLEQDMWQLFVLAIKSNKL